MKTEFATVLLVVGQLQAPLSSSRALSPQLPSAVLAPIPDTAFFNRIETDHE